MPGNSGSPVIDASTQKVIALHHAGSRQDEVNFAILMSSIVKKSPILLASLQEDINPSETTTDATPNLAQCDVLYDAAVKANQCFAYKAYANSCSAHALAPIAKEYIQTFCQTEVTSVPSEKTNTRSDWNKGELIAGREEYAAFKNLVEINKLKQLPVGERISLINDFVYKYPNSKLMPNVQYMLGVELGIKRDLKASAKVFLYNYKKYPNSDVSSRTLLELATTLIKLDQKDAGCNLLSRIQVQHPESQDVISDADYVRKGECR